MLESLFPLAPIWNSLSSTVTVLKIETNEPKFPPINVTLLLVKIKAVYCFICLQLKKTSPKFYNRKMNRWANRTCFCTSSLNTNSGKDKNVSDTYGMSWLIQKGHNRGSSGTKCNDIFSWSGYACWWTSCVSHSYSLIVRDFLVFEFSECCFIIGLTPAYSECCTRNLTLYISSK